MIQTIISSNSGNVIGASSVTDKSIARFNGTNGKILQGSSIVIDDSGNFTNINSLTFATSTVTSGFGIDLGSFDSLVAGGAIIRAKSNSADTGTRNLVFVRNQNTLATGTTSLSVQQDAANTCLSVLSSGVGISLSSTGNFNAMTISSSATSNNALRFSTTSQTTAAIISIPNADSLTNGNALNLVSNSSSSTSRNLIFMRNQNASATAAVVFRCQQDSTASAFVIDRSAVASTNGALVINDSGTSTGAALEINNSTTAPPFKIVYTTSTPTTTWTAGVPNSNPTKYIKITDGTTTTYIPTWA